MIAGEEKCTLVGAQGKLEALWSPGEQGIMVIAHPLPSAGGNMQHKVVATLAGVARDCGYASLRFNFSGVGASEGQERGGPGAYDDLMAVLQFVRSTYPSKPLFLAGFSFGGTVAAACAAEHGSWIQALITVAPACDKFVPVAMDAIQIPWLIVQGEDDLLCPLAALQACLARSPQAQPTLVTVPETEHFFHGKLPLLRQTVRDWLHSLP